MGEESDTKTVLECEESCESRESLRHPLCEPSTLTASSADDTCRSYSFNDKEGICVWSVETIRYRIGWEFWTKVHDLDAFGQMQHYGKYR